MFLPSKRTVAGLFAGYLVNTLVGLDSGKKNYQSSVLISFPFYGILKRTPVMRFKIFWKNESVSCYGNLSNEYFKNLKLH